MDRATCGELLRQRECENQRSDQLQDYTTKLSPSCWTPGSVYTWERVTDLSPVGNCSQAMEGVAGQRPANVARMERNSDDLIPEKFVLELKRQDEEGCWESTSSPLLMTNDVQNMKPASMKPSVTRLLTTKSFHFV